MEDKLQEILDDLDRAGIPYELVRHVAVYTIEEMNAVGINDMGCIAKNLFLRDNKGKRHFLVSVVGSKTVDLTKLGGIVGERLGFASEDRLARKLNLTKGAVTPLGIYYNEEHDVDVYLDADLCDEPRIGVHPCDNTATVFLSYADLERYLKSKGNKVTVIRL